MGYSSSTQAFALGALDHQRGPWNQHIVKNNLTIVYPYIYFVFVGFT